VAWISERKDVLSTLLWFLALLAYHRHVRSPSPRRMLAVLLFSALGLATKPMLVTLPFTLLLLDYWPLNRLGANASRGGVLSLLSRSARGLWIEKAPLFLLAALTGALTLHAQAAGGATRSMESFPLAARAANAAVAAVGYLYRTILPRGLAVYYPFREDIPVLLALGAALLLLAVTAAVLRPDAAPAAATGWLWYLGTLLPVIGIVQVGGQAMADRYTYVPLLGIFVAAAWGPGGRRRVRLPPAVVVVTVTALLLALIGASHRQVATWRSSETLYRHALAVTKGNWLIEFNYAAELARTGRTEEALEHYRRCLTVHPDFAAAHMNLGVLLHREGRSLEALEHLRRAVEADPGSAQARMNLGIVLERLGRDREAAVHFREAIRSRAER
jgi:tetratricopeptide (TPR) repeat protein